MPSPPFVVKEQCVAGVQRIQSVKERKEGKLAGEDNLINRRKEKAHAGGQKKPMERKALMHTCQNRGLG
jgi:hypothetical protein